MTRWHWMGADSWSSLTRELVPIVTAVIAAAAGWVLRRCVTPAWRWIEEHEPELADEIDDATGVDVDQVLAEADAIYSSRSALKKERQALVNMLHALGKKVDTIGSDVAGSLTRTAGEAHARARGSVKARRRRRPAVRGRPTSRPSSPHCHN